MPSRTDAAQYAEKHPSTTTLLPSGKLQFTKSGMEFPVTTSWKMLEAYANGLAYKRALRMRANEGYDFSQHEPYVVEHKHRDKNHFLYCKLTRSVLPRRKDVITGHINGKRFKRMFKDAERKREEAERIAAKRKERRLARAVKKGGKEAAEGEKEHGDEKNGEMEAPDFGKAVQSDDDEEMDGAEKNDRGEGEEEEGEGEASKDESEGDEETKDEEMEERSEPGNVLIERIKEDEKEGEVFWTRGRRGARRMTNRISGDEDKEMEDAGDEGKTPKKLKARAKRGKRAVPSPDVTIEKDNDAVPVSNGHEEPGPVTRKRSRSDKTPKKTRRPRQRNKSAPTET